MLIFYTSHNMFEVEQICDEVIFMNKGKIKMRGSPDEIKENLKQQNMEDVLSPNKEQWCPCMLA